MLQYLMPWDIARFLAASGCRITKREEKDYMHPTRDVFINYDEITLLAQSGLHFLLVGDQLPLLRQRLRDATRFIERYGDEYVINLVVIAYCDPEVPLNAPGYAYAPSLRFTVTDRLLERLGERSDLAHFWLEHSLDTLPCTQTSLAIIETPETSNVRLKQFKLNLRSLWFNTIDLLHPSDNFDIFNWSDDEDSIETSIMLVRHNKKGLVFHDTKATGSWLPQPKDQCWVGARGTPALTQHRPSTNTQQVMIRLEVPSSKKVGILRLPTPYE